MIHLQTMVIGLAIILASLTSVHCQTSQLPKKVPTGLKIEFFAGGGLLPAFTKIKVSGNILTVEEQRFDQENPTLWSREITPGDVKKLYQVFYHNRFDLIKNDERQGVALDAATETISLSFGRKSYRAAYGMNSPLSGASKTRYLAVSASIRDLVERLRAKDG
jgi:hypothetical protein